MRWHVSTGSLRSAHGRIQTQVRGPIGSGEGQVLPLVCKAFRQRLIETAISFFSPMGHPSVSLFPF